MDWCEPNNHVTIYVKEFYNTISNIGFFVVSYKLKYDTPIAIITCLIGFFSTLYHMFLTKETQLLDELSISLLIIYYNYLYNFSNTYVILSMIISIIFPYLSPFCLILNIIPSIIHINFIYNNLNLINIKEKQLLQYDGLKVCLFLGISLIYWGIERLSSFLMDDCSSFSLFHAYWHMFSAYTIYKFHLFTKKILYLKN